MLSEWGTESRYGKWGGFPLSEPPCFSHQALGDPGFGRRVVVQSGIALKAGGPGEQVGWSPASQGAFQPAETPRLAASRGSVSTRARTNGIPREGQPRPGISGWGCQPGLASTLGPCTEPKTLGSWWENQAAVNAWLL